jgi:predicted nucleic acid-binding protein
MPLVYADTNVWIKVLTGEDGHEICDELIVAASQKDIRLVGSWLLRAEISKPPTRSVDEAVVGQVEQLLDSEGILWVDVDRFVARAASDLARQFRLGGADAVHLATAVVCEEIQYAVASSIDSPAVSEWRALADATRDAVIPDTWTKRGGGSSVGRPLVVFESRWLDEKTKDCYVSVEVGNNYGLPTASVMVVACAASARSGSVPLRGPGSSPVPPTGRRGPAGRR